MLRLTARFTWMTTLIVSASDEDGDVEYCMNPLMVMLVVHVVGKDTHGYEVLRVVRLNAEGDTCRDMVVGHGRVWRMRMGRGDVD